MHRLTTAALAVMLTVVPALSETVEVTFLIVNDTDKIETGNRGGFARLAAVIANERETRDNVVVVHAGDLISPSLFSAIDKGKHAVDLLNKVDIDVFVPGNHEFDFGPDVFRERMAELAMPKVVANLTEADGSALAGFEPTATVTFGSVSVGIVGLSSPDAVEKSSPGDIQFGDMVDALRREADALSTDLVVAVAHASRSQDMELVESRLADLVLSGDDHDLTLFYDGRTVLAEAREQAAYIPAIDVAFSVEGEGTEREVDTDYSFRIIDTLGVTPVASVQEALDGYTTALDKEMDVVIGRTATPLDSRRASVRTQETALGNFIADAMRQVVKADAAITNGGGIRGDKQYPAGTELTRRDVLTELPFGNATVSYELSGADLIAALENGVSAVEDTSGRFPQVSGLTVEADLSQPAGSRITRVTVGGAPLDPAATYTVATNDFMGRGGDGYTAFGNGTPGIESRNGPLMAAAVMAFIEATDEISPKVEGRIVLK